MSLFLQDLRCDADGMSILGLLNADLEKCQPGITKIDCTLLKWMDGNLAAPLVALVEKSRSRSVLVEFESLSGPVRRIFERTGLVTSRIYGKQETTLPLISFRADQSKDFAAYTDRYLTKDFLPVMTEDLRDKIFEGIDELFNNSVIHSKSDYSIFSCGQFFPKRNRLELSLVDLGVGFRRNVTAYLKKDISSSEAIDWALTGNNTTRSGDIPGGLGLKILREFIQLNAGRLIIYSDTGYWCLSKGATEKRNLTHSFPGVVVTLEINTADQAHYDLKR